MHDELYERVNAYETHFPDPDLNPSHKPSESSQLSNHTTNDNNNEQNAKINHAATSNAVPSDSARASEPSAASNVKMEDV